MTFRPDVSLDPGQVRDRRGRGGVLAVGGGLGGVVLVVIFLLLAAIHPTCPPELLTGQTVGSGQQSDLNGECQTGADANLREDCRIVGYVNSIQAYWSGAVNGYQLAYTTFYTDGIDTGCGCCLKRGRPVLLPGGCQCVHRPRVLRRAADALRCRRWAIRRGVRHRPRVRPPRPGPARPVTGRRHRDGRREHLGAASSSRRTATPACGRATR